MAERVAGLARLIVVQGDATIRELELAGSALLGRGENCGIVLLDGACSRQHVRIEPRGVDWFAVDLESTNGLFVNGSRVKDCRLDDGDEIALGGVRLRFRAPLPGATIVVGGASARTPGDTAAGDVTDRGPTVKIPSPLGKTLAFVAARAIAEKAAKSSLPVLLRGETGTGKEIFAHYIHSTGPRRDKPFVALHAAAIPSALFESELFGSEKGAFTGADSRREGFIARAHGGTLFLDEIGELSLDTQVKLLRVLETGEYHPVGSSRARQSDFRLIAATNRDLERAVKDSHFRSDLLFRLNAVELRLPPLRERLDDLPLFVEHFLLHSEKRPAADLLDALRSRPWVGNVRELRNALDRAVLLSESPTVGAADLPLPASVAAPEAVPDLAVVDSVSALSLDRAERAAIERVLRKTGGRRGEAARMLGIAEPTLRRKLRRYGLDTGAPDDGEGGR